MLWTLKEVVSMFNSEHDDHITYYTVHKIISEERHLLQSARTPQDDCRCEKCENVELLLKAIKTNLNKAGKKNCHLSYLQILGNLLLVLYAL